MIRLTALALVLFALSQDKPLHPLQEALSDVDPEGDWHYNDPAAGFAEAKATGKPVLLVFRCTP
jgi:serine protease Do